MQIEAIYKNGILIPLVPLKLKKKQGTVKLVIPDEQVEQVPEKQSKLRERINAILGEYGHPRPSRTPEEDKAVWQRHLEEKYAV